MLIKTKYIVKINESTEEHEETREVKSIREQHQIILANWFGIASVQFIEDMDIEKYNESIKSIEEYTIKYGLNHYEF